MNKDSRILMNGIILLIILAIVSTTIWSAVAEGDGSLDTSYSWIGNGGYVASGDSTRSSTTGIITVSGIPDNSYVEEAFIYWASTDLPTKSPDENITLDSSSITGNLIGTDSYWRMYRSEVTSLVTGNGVYAIGGLDNVFGPSIVVIYSNDNSPSTRVIIADGADNNGNDDATGLMDAVTFSEFTVPAIFQAYLTFIIADGDSGYNDRYYFNDNPIATNAAEGSEGEGAYLWDTDTYEVTSYLTEGDTTATANVFEGPNPFGDELGWEVCIFSISPNYNFNGFFSPVDNAPAMNMVKAGSAIPIKFSLGGYQGLDIFETDYPRSYAIDCDTTVSSSEYIVTVTPGSSSLSYNNDKDQYNYVWKTDRKWSNTCRQFVVELNDGSEHRANFEFK